MITCLKSPSQVSHSVLPFLNGYPTSEESYDMMGSVELYRPET